MGSARARWSLQGGGLALLPLTPVAFTSPCPCCKATASLMMQNTRFPTFRSEAWERDPPDAESKGPSLKQRTARPRGSWGAREGRCCCQLESLPSGGASPTFFLRGINQASVLSLFASPLTVWSKSIHSHTTKSKVSQA